MFFVEQGQSLQLDIVGIVAILGEGSILRNAQASSLSWHFTLPRLIPAPQALLKHEQASRLPTQKGIVSGVYSGNVRTELNFWTGLLHPLELKKNQIEVVEVTRDAEEDQDFIFGVNDHGVLPLLSYLGCLMSCALLGLSIWRRDGFALIATILLSVTSTMVGTASRWRLVFKEERPQTDREKVIPDGDVIIYYPHGAIRVVRCDEVVSRLYFQAEECEYTLTDNQYRSVAMAASVTLIFGLICLSNAHVILQISFAAAYIILNALYWASSAYHENHHWSHAYNVRPIKIGYPIRQGTGLHDIVVPSQDVNPDHALPKRQSTVQLEEGTSHAQTRRPSMISLRKLTSRSVPLQKVNTTKALQPLPESMATFTEILWTAIALTRNTRWLKSPIVPDTKAWEDWVAEAAKAAQQDPVRVGDKIFLPHWDFKTRLRELLKEQSKVKTRRPEWPSLKRLSGLIAAAERDQQQKKPRMAEVAMAIKKRMEQQQLQQLQSRGDSDSQDDGVQQHVTIEEPTTPDLPRRRRTVQFSEEEQLTQSPVNELASDDNP